MGRGRPHKPQALKDLEGNRGKDRRPSVPDMDLQGFPELPDSLASEHARNHFRDLAGEFAAIKVLKRADTPALHKLAMTWALLIEAFEGGDVDAFCKLSAAWDRSASKLGIQVVDRAKLMALAMQSKEPEVNPLRAKFQVRG